MTVWGKGKAGIEMDRQRSTLLSYVDTLVRPSRVEPMVAERGTSRCTRV